MDIGDTQANSYEPLEGRRNTGHTDSPEIDTGPPQDRRHTVYLALLTAGIGFVLPYNSFIIASDYWQARFPGRSVALDMSMTYIIVAFGTVLLNNVFLSLAPFKIRIAFGYAVSFVTLIFVALCEVGFNMFRESTAYSVNLAAVSFVAIGCTVQQSSFYGFASMLPKQYTLAVMAGESLAGLLVSSNRVVTKLMIHSDQLSTVIFFFTSTIYIAFSYVLHAITIHSPFVQYHLKACAKIILRPDEDRVLTDPSDNDPPKYGVLTLDSSPPIPIPPAPALSFCNPVYELSNPSAGESTLENLTSEINGSGPAVTTTIVPKPMLRHEPPNVAYKVEHVITPESCRSGFFGSFKNGFESRWRVAHSIYPYMVCIALAYCVTLSLYPGIESEIISCTLGTWMPVLLMFTFNIADVLGKLLAVVPYSWSRRQLILMSGLRALLIPLLLLCCTPREKPIIAGETAAFIFSAALGVTNGLAGSLPMMLAPAKVPATLKEVTGNIMTLSYNVGLTAGSLIGYVFESMLGPQIPFYCDSYPYIPSTPAINLTTSTTTTTTMAPLISLLTSTTSSAVVSTLLTSTSTFQSSAIGTNILNSSINYGSTPIEIISDDGQNQIVSIATTAFYNVTHLLLSNNSNTAFDNNE